MNKSIKHIVIGATMSVMALGSFGAIANEAASQGGPGAKARHAHMSAEGHHKRMDPAKFQEKMAQRQAELRQKLNITSAQEPAWNAFTASMTPPERGQRPDRAEMDKLTAPERMEKRLQGMKQMEAHMTKQLNSMKTLYSQLTPDQRAVFDESMKMGRKHHKRG